MMHAIVSQPKQYIPKKGGQEISRILSAAVINHDFQHTLLNDPIAAISKGFQGECFAFSPKQKASLANIQAADLAGFASRILLM